MADSLAEYLKEHPKALATLQSQLAENPRSVAQAYDKLISAMQLDGFTGKFPTDVQEIVDYYKSLPIVPGSPEQLKPGVADQSAQQGALQYVEQLIKRGPEQAGDAAAQVKESLLATNEAAQTAVPNTLDAFLLRNDISRPFFDPPTGATGQNFEAMRKDVSNGDFTLTSDQMKSARMLAQEIMDLAKSKGVDITQFDDIKQVMGYDKNAKELSVDEMAAYLVGKSVSGSVSSGLGGRTQIQTNADMRATLSPEAQKLALEAGRQVFGDNHPTASSTNTQTPESMQPVKDALPKMRC